MMNSILSKSLKAKIILLKAPLHCKAQSLTSFHCSFHKLHFCKSAAALPRPPHIPRASERMLSALQVLFVSVGFMRLIDSSELGTRQKSKSKVAGTA